MRKNSFLFIGLLIAGCLMLIGCSAMRDSIRKNKGGTGGVALAPVNGNGGISATNQQPQNPAEGSSLDANDETTETSSQIAVATNTEPVIVPVVQKNADGSKSTNFVPVLDKKGNPLLKQTAVFATNAPPDTHTKKVKRSASSDIGKSQKVDYIEGAKNHLGGLWGGVIIGVLVALAGIFTLFDYPPILAVMPNKFKYLMIIGGTVTAIICYMLAEHIVIVLSTLGGGLALWFLIDFVHEHGNVKGALSLMSKQAESPNMPTALLRTAEEIRPQAPPDQPPV